MNTFFRYMKTVLTAFPIFVVVVLSGWGGGGGGGAAAPAVSTIISGTAAAGAPVIGYVSVRDSSTNTQPVKTNIPIQANGGYSVDVAGLKAPYAFQAIGTVGGKTVSLYSAATSSDVGNTINITPFTDLIIRNVAAGVVDTYINNGSFASLTAAQLDAKRVALTTLLTPALTAMGVSGSIDLLRSAFNANGTGLDRFMDAVQVSTTPTTATITNILDAANTLVITTATGTPTGTLSTVGLAPSATPLDGIMASMNAFSSFFATGLPSPTDPNLLALFTSTSFLDDGKGVSAFLTDITTQQKIVGLKFTNVVIDSINTVSGVAQVHFAPIAGSGINLSRDQVGGAVGMQMVKNATTGAWQFDGNQRIAHVRVRAAAYQNVCASGTCGTPGTTYQTGLMLVFDNKGQKAIGSVVITGNGLPAGGVTLTPAVGQTYFGISTANPNFPCTGTGCSGNNNWQMLDADIAKVLPNSSYTIAVYSNANPAVLLATYTEVVPVAPVLNTAVAGLAYPSLSGLKNIAGKTAATLPLTWGMPAALFGNLINVYAYQMAGNTTTATANIVSDLSFQNASSGTATLALTAPASGTWTGGSYWIAGWDLYGGVVSTSYQ